MSNNLGFLQHGQDTGTIIFCIIASFDRKPAKGKVKLTSVLIYLLIIISCLTLLLSSDKNIIRTYVCFVNINVYLIPHTDYTNLQSLLLILPEAPPFLIPVKTVVYKWSNQYLQVYSISSRVPLLSICGLTLCIRSTTRIFWDHSLMIRFLHGQWYPFGRLPSSHWNISSSNNGRILGGYTKL